MYLVNGQARRDVLEQVNLTTQDSERLLEFDGSHKLAMANILFSHNISLRTMSHAPNGIRNSSLTSHLLLRCV